MLPPEKDEWYKIVRKHISKKYNFSEDATEKITKDIVKVCVAYNSPSLDELPEYIAEYIEHLRK